MLSHFRRKRLGDKYEQFVYELLLSQGWSVTKRNALGFDDEGIDLIANKGSRRAYVQCKGWSPKRHIHENVVDHFYGSVAYQVGPHNAHTVDMLLFVSAPLTAQAQAHADKLGVQVMHEDYNDSQKNRLAGRRFFRSN